MCKLSQMAKLMLSMGSQMPSAPCWSLLPPAMGKASSLVTVLGASTILLAVCSAATAQSLASLASSLKVTEPLAPFTTMPSSRIVSHPRTASVWSRPCTTRNGLLMILPMILTSSCT